MPLALRLDGMGPAARVHQLAVPGGADGDAGGEGGDVVGEPDAQRPVLKLELGKPTCTAGPVVPTARPIIHPVPVVTLTFSARVMRLTMAGALLELSAQPALAPPLGVGYHGGDWP